MNSKDQNLVLLLRCVPRDQRIKIGKSEWFAIGEVTHRAAERLVAYENVIVELQSRLAAISAAHLATAALRRSDEV